MVRRKNLCSSVRSVGDINNHPWGKDITDPLYLPLKRGGLVCPLLESPRNVLLMYSKTLSINFSASKQTASPPLGETGEGFHNVGHCIFEITDPLYLPLKWGGPVCPLLESPLECLVDVYKTLSINFSASKQTASPPLGETGEGFHNVEHCIFEITAPSISP